MCCVCDVFLRRLIVEWHSGTLANIIEEARFKNVAWRLMQLMPTNLKFTCGDTLTLLLSSYWIVKERSTASLILDQWLVHNHKKSKMSGLHTSLSMRVMKKVCVLLFVNVLCCVLTYVVYTCREPSQFQPCPLQGQCEPASSQLAPGTSRAQARTIFFDHFSAKSLSQG